MIMCLKNHDRELDWAVLEIMNGFILCVVRTYDISEIFCGVLFGSRIFNSDFRDFIIYC